ncbi:MAG: hypothetical protein N838_10750 [Thiohalocapsa sp. PB-PSB1]|jgi:hypothetical protein|nr:MAG: hypothetical protein N838_04470 [Thiohalocapsa sp. PB-PSB1]QQO53762.1 MAG: hypothetical protein N838_10750 [Thiohalocapsa sp. PB-PSB1]HCS91653.1 hypothetical protein [Chromatiaceae bacterium]
MTISEKQRQKKLQQKKRKRLQAARATQGGLSASTRTATLARLPIHECLMPGALFESGIGGVLFARRTAGNQIAFSFFLVDSHCLGVKNAMFSQRSESEYENLKVSILAQPGQGDIVMLEPACARKLVEGAVAYAQNLGFSPHSDYRKANAIFGGVDPNDCQTEFEYGKDGKPFYMRGPHETLSRAKRIVEQLDKRCGSGNYHYLISLDDAMIG